jgi:hypothetical protein
MGTLTAGGPRAGRMLAGAVAAGAVYFLGLHLCIRYIAGHPGGRFTVLLAVAPVLAIAAALAVLFRYVRLADELHQRIHLEAMSFAFLALLLVVSTRDMLDFIGVRVGQPAFLMPTMVLLWVAGLALSLYRYR